MARPSGREGGGFRYLPRARYLVAGAVVLAVLGGLWANLDAARKWLDRQAPVRKVAMNGDFRHTDPQALARWMGDRLEGGFFTADLTRLQVRTEERPWIRSVRIRRQWPDTLRVRVEEQQPRALWSHGGQWRLVNEAGVVFKPLGRGDPGDLPRLAGPRADLDALLERLAVLKERLGGHRITRVRVDARGAWMAEVDGRVALHFGRRNWKQRLARFLRVEREWRLLERAVSRIDLRYPDGLAVATTGQGTRGDRAATGHPPNKG
ncbi:cell division protein FtsQ/DivIB [Thiohalorhabdus sp. Cl-TMA]|uniref:Cell division protein FtsQ n=1 Tax=Thiohalorhabdus methylotrophus TaxID=3242694 RepID=A0ABV4TVQ2_9GAMM